MQYFLGIDFGGGASKATLLGSDGQVAATYSVEYPTYYPQSGYAEQNPYEWYDAVRKNIMGVLKKSGVPSSDIIALCLDAATHTAVLMDKDFNVLRPAIYWTDSRSIEQSDILKKNYGDLILKQALHKPDTIWTLPQLLWIRDNEPEIWNKTKRIMFAKDYVRFMLTDVYCTDIIEAQGSMLFDYNTMNWSDRLCEISGFSVDNLPTLHKPTDIIGSVTKKASADTGLKVGTPVLCGTTDTVMEVFAAGAVAKGQMTVKLATAGRICVVTEKSYPHPHLINYSHVAEGLWYPGTATKSCAASYRWYRDTFGESYSELDKGAAKIPAGSDGLMFHPYLNGELTPYADPLLRGSFTGVRAGHTKAHFNRAVLEGVALSLLDCKEALEQIGVPHENTATIIGGGANSKLWRQIMADVLGMELRQNQNSDSSFGSAMLAGVAVGVFSGLQNALDSCNKASTVTKPNKENTDLYADIYKQYKKIHDALAPVYHEMG
ncbi:MAG: FGGY family carbohydrate kinase [Oscillospiraceae bacterium]|nr:FGGY family carbohydrate kinase [Oscillospiraceae bacterium]